MVQNRMTGFYIFFGCKIQTEFKKKLWNLPASSPDLILPFYPLFKFIFREHKSARFKCGLTRTLGKYHNISVEIHSESVYIKYANPPCHWRSPLLRIILR